MPQPLRLGPIAGALAVVTLIAAAGISASLGAFNGLGAKPAAVTVNHSKNIDRDSNAYGVPAATTPHSVNVDRDGASAVTQVTPYVGHFRGSSRGVEGMTGTTATPKKVGTR
jgi:hypothetical protein